MIQPTIGRIVWFQPSKAPESPALAQPHAAIVTYVHSDRCINICAFDPNGVPMSRTSVMLVQEGDIPPVGGYYAEWMPYQKGQASKLDSLQPKAGS